MAKKGGLAIVLGLGKKPGSGDDSMDDDGDASMDASAKDDAADALISAVHDKDRAGVVDAVETLVRLCKPGDYKGDSEEEP